MKTFFATIGWMPTIWLCVFSACIVVICVGSPSWRLVVKLLSYYACITIAMFVVRPFLTNFFLLFAVCFLLSTRAVPLYREKYTGYWMVSLMASVEFFFYAIAVYHVDSSQFPGEHLWMWHIVLPPVLMMSVGLGIRLAAHYLIRRYNSFGYGITHSDDR